MGAAVLAIGSAAEVAEEAEEQATKTTTATMSSTSSSTATETPAYVVALDQKWPSLIIDAFLEAFPDNGDGSMQDFNALGVKTYLPNITSYLADAISILPVFDYVIVNDLGPNAFTEDEDLSWDILDDPNEAEDIQSHETKQLLTERFDSEFPRFNGLTILQQKPARPQLALISRLEGSEIGATNDYLSEGSEPYDEIDIFVVDSGFGPTTGAVKVPSVSHILASCHYCQTAVNNAHRTYLTWISTKNLPWATTIKLVRKIMFLRRTSTATRPDMAPVWQALLAV